MYILTYCDEEGKRPTRIEYTQEERDSAITEFFCAMDRGMTNLWLQHVDGPVLIAPGNRTK